MNKYKKYLNSIQNLKSKIKVTIRSTEELKILDLSKLPFVLLKLIFFFIFNV